MQKFWLVSFVSMLGLGLALSPIQAAELQVLAGGAMTAPLQELATQFERHAGHKLCAAQSAIA